MIVTFLVFQGGSAEVELVKGQTIILTTNPEWGEKGDLQKVFVDYTNIVKVVKVGSRVFVDDGLISLIVQEVGKTQTILLQICLDFCTVLTIILLRPVQS